MGKVLHASGSGYFIECIEESGDSRNAIWTLENAMKLYWRVRSYKFDASGTIEEDGDISSFSTNIDNMKSTFFSVPDDERIPTTREEQLVCGDLERPSFTDLDFSNLENIIEVGVQGVFKVGNLYNPSFEGFIYDPTPNVQYSIAAIPGYDEVSSDISLLGGSIPIGARSAVSTAVVLSLTATLTPKLWWSYGGTYNTSTGARL